MTPPDSLRTLAFGGAEDSDPWGAAWFPAAGPGLLRVGVGGAGEGLEAELLEATGEGESEGESDGTWRVRSSAGELILAPAGDAVDISTAGQPAGFEQLCTVTGELAVGGAPTTIAGPGRRGERRGAQLAGLDSVREISAWFDPGEAIALLALRPRKVKGQDQDMITAAVIIPEGWPAVTDPRLSTTYSAEGRPARVGLELWSDEPESYPRRLAGESTGGRAVGEAGGWSVSAERLVCHSRGHDGTGVYLIARPA